MRLLAAGVLALVGATLGAPTEASVGLVWEPCEDRPAVRCASLDVPLDRSDPGSGTISLAVRRSHATDPDRRLGVLVTIAGGPGQRGTEWVYRGAHSPEIEARFDVVSFDPRGTSGETAITCIPDWDPFGELDRTPDDVVERSTLDERIRALAAECRVVHAGILPHVGTADTVLDLEALREALGEDRISVFGSSYGSEVALRYATAFPNRIRAVVLDGYSDPNRSPIEIEVEQAAAFERELDELLVECALRPDCPLDDPAPGTVLDQLIAALDVAPLPAGSGGVLRQNDAYEAITGALVGGPQHRQRLLGAIAAADLGDGAALLAIADHTREAFEASGLDLGTFMAIACADDRSAWAALSEEDISDLTERVLEVAPRLGPWLWSPPAADDLLPVGLCSMSPAGIPTAPGPFDGAGAGPILVLAASGDPTTPRSAAARAVEELQDVALVEVRADQHLVYPHTVAAPGTATHACVLETVEAYLIRGSLPEPGRCS